MRDLQMRNELLIGAEDVLMNSLNNMIINEYTQVQSDSNDQTNKQVLKLCISLKIEQQLE